MKLINTICPKCGASLEVDTDADNIRCEYCRANIFVDDEDEHFSFDNAEQAGYEFEKGRIRAQQEALKLENANNKVVYSSKKSSNILLWILGWIIFPFIPLTIIIIRSKKLSVTAKIVLLALIWLFFIVVASTTDTEENEATDSQTTAHNVVTSITRECDYII